MSSDAEWRAGKETFIESYDLASEGRVYGRHCYIGCLPVVGGLELVVKGLMSMCCGGGERRGGKSNEVIDAELRAQNDQTSIPGPQASIH